MSDEAPPKKQESSGAPAWVMTFADLMSLLMCFFVLLLSFSEMDLLKFKQIAGSMKAAFGVQREIKADQSPKGTSFIAREFTPGRPTPTLIKEIRQNTIDETKQTVEFTDAVTQEKDADSLDPNQDSEGAGEAAMQRHPRVVKLNAEDPLDETEIAKLDEKLLEQIAKEANTKNNDTEQDNAADGEEGKQAADLEKHKKTMRDALTLVQMLEQEVNQGLVEIKTAGNRILLRINEKGSFPSGSATVKSSFLPVLKKLRNTLEKIQGNIIVAGHTDNIPIKTARFRSNWELSAARAVTVVHELLNNKKLLPERFILEGHGDGHPIASNNTASDRARNRRVELTIVQQDDTDSVNLISADNPFTSHLLDAQTPALTTNVQRILDQRLKPLEKTKPSEKEDNIKGQFDKLRNSLQGETEKPVGLIETVPTEIETKKGINVEQKTEDPETIQGHFEAIRDSIVN